MTDNGSNFLKCFKVFGVKPDSDPDDSSVENEDSNSENEEIVDILLLPADNEDIVLLPYLSCAAHTLNLVAAHDVPQGAGNSKAILRSTKAKCSSLWNKTHRSTQSA